MKPEQDEVLPYPLSRYAFWLVILAIAVFTNNFVWYALSRADVPNGGEVAYPSGNTSNVSAFTMPRWEFDVEGITQPPLCRPADVLLSDDERVIGVVVDDEARAYVVRAFELTMMQSPEDCGVHLVADSVAGQPLWVTHCDRTHSTRVFTSGVKDSLPDVRVGGWSDGLMLTVDDRRFSQNDRSLPLSDAEYTVTSWKKWLKRHPKTLVYTGDACSETSDTRSHIH
jgi:hypothetical protein